MRCKNGRGRYYTSRYYTSAADKGWRLLHPKRHSSVPALIRFVPSAFHSPRRQINSLEGRQEGHSDGTFGRVVRASSFPLPRPPLTSLKCASDCIAGTARRPRETTEEEREKGRESGINIPAICMRGGALVRFDVATRAGAYTGIFALIQSEGMRPPRINIFRIIRLCLR